MIEDCYRPGVPKTMRRSRFPINRRAMISVSAIHFRSRHIAKHFQSQKRGFRRKNSLWSLGAVARCELQRPQFAIVRERRIQPDQILQRNFRPTQWKGETVERFGFWQTHLCCAQKLIKSRMLQLRSEFDRRHIPAARQRVARADWSEKFA